MIISDLIVLLTLQNLGGLFFFSRRNKKNEKIEDDHYKDNLLCLFVLDGAGRKIGESIAVDDDVLIIKSGSKYLGVPLKHIEEEEKTLLVKGLLDLDKAEEMGEEWRQESFKEIDHKEGIKDGF